MPSGRPRTAQDPRAARGRILPDAELADHAPEFIPAPAYWREATTTAYGEFRKSEAAKVLRQEDVAAVLRLFVYIDALAERTDALKFSTDPSAVIRDIRTLETVVIALSTAVGLGPRARQSLGILTERQPGSKLASFNARQD